MTLPIAAGLSGESPPAVVVDLLQQVAELLHLTHTTAGRILGQSVGQMYPAFSLVQLIHYCPLIGGELLSVEIFPSTERRPF